MAPLTATDDELDKQPKQERQAKKATRAQGASSRRVKDPDKDEYVPYADRNEESNSEVDPLDYSDASEDLDDNEIEVKKVEVDGTVSLVTKTASPISPEELERKIKSDPRWKDNEMRSRCRMSRVVFRYKERQPDIDMSDGAPGKDLKGAKTVPIECKNGNFICNANNGYTQKTAEEIAVWEKEQAAIAGPQATSSSEGCSCEICTKRAAFHRKRKHSVDVEGPRKE
ncbi:MAG: hypothetical protein M1820_008612 [Bogoriella megaspora]|nr:MAG: hypothetical protein M1820_008612 [Bogoriella megaspora]